MKQEYKKRWLKALRSDKYEQRKHQLTYDNGYCCMGVLCNILQKDLNVKWEGDYFLDEDLNLPKQVLDLVGLKDPDPITSRGSLAHLNDDEGLSFKEIADIIEKEL